MNDLLVALDLSAWKPWVTALLLPPMPGIALVMLGFWIFARGQRKVAGALVGVACMGLWASGNSEVGRVLIEVLLRPPPALTLAELAPLRAGHEREPGAWAIVVLGGGKEDWSPEYGGPNLGTRSMERLRYGLWLARQTGLPVAFSGGIGRAGGGFKTEAEVAAHIASQEFQVPLRWQESRSRDTRENATFSVALLGQQGVHKLVLVTHGWHMRRAQRAFQDAADQAGLAVQVIPAPVGLSEASESSVQRWMPTNEGLQRVRDALRETLGRLAGA